MQTDAFRIIFLYLHLKCVFANILLISFIFNFIFMFCICTIIIIDLIFVDFRFFSFCRKLLNLCWQNTRWKLKPKSKNIQTDASCTKLIVELYYILIILTKLGYFIFMFCICTIIIIDLIFVDFRFFSFCLEICTDIWIKSKCSFPFPIFINRLFLYQIDCWIVLYSNYFNKT
jgi:hypothetical protein